MMCGFMALREGGCGANLSPEGQKNTKKNWRDGRKNGCEQLCDDPSKILMFTYRCTLEKSDDTSLVARHVHLLDSYFI